jgi:hypothetical protein
MVKCERCDKEFITKQGYEYHVERNVCVKPDRTCDKCGHTFVSKVKLLYHLEHKVCDKKPKHDICIKSITSSRETELLQKVAVLEAEKKVLIENPKTVNNQINFIFPHAFGSEQTSRILSKLPNLLYETLTNHSSRSIEYLTEQIHCNKEVFPEYTNVYIRNYKSPFALVSDGKRFQHKPQKRIIEEIIDSSMGMLQQYIDTTDDSLGHKIIKKYEDYCDLVDTSVNDTKKSERRKDLEIEIAGMLLDMRPIIESDPTLKPMLDRLEVGEFTQ